MASLTSRLHRVSPVWLQDLAVSLYGYRVVRERYGGEFEALLADATRSTFAPLPELSAEQERLWKTRIAPALLATPAYGAGVHFGQLGTLPELTKDRLRGDLPRYRNPTVPTRRRLKAHTSGTTGAGLQFETTLFSHRRQWAFWWRYREWHGIPFGEWCGIFGGRAIVPAGESSPPFWRRNQGGRSLMFSQYHLTPERVPLYLEAIRRARLRWLHGYPSILALLSRVGIELGLAGSVELRWVTTGAENLLESQRRDIQRMFGVVPRQHYGLAEGVANISECPHGRLHVDEDFSVVEFLPREDGLEGARVVGTTLDNEAMPLVRYDTGDVAALAPPGQSCDCGRAGRVVSSLDGRREDYVVLSDGSLVGRVDHLFKDAVRVTEAQVIQDKPGEVVFRIVRGDGYSSADERALLEESRARFGDRLRVDFDYVKSLPRPAGGKLRLVESRLNSSRIN